MGSQPELELEALRVDDTIQEFAAFPTPEAFRGMRHLPAAMRRQLLSSKKPKKPKLPRDVYEKDVDILPGDAVSSLLPALASLHQLTPTVADALRGEPHAREPAGPKLTWLILCWPVTLLQFLDLRYRRYYTAPSAWHGRSAWHGMGAVQRCNSCES